MRFRFPPSMFQCQRRTGLLKRIDTVRSSQDKFYCYELQKLVHGESTSTAIVGNSSGIRKALALIVSNFGRTFP